MKFAISIEHTMYNLIWIFYPEIKLPFLAQWHKNKITYKIIQLIIQIVGNKFYIV